MAKYHGKIGYATMTETAPGVWEEVMTERKAYGDVTRNARRYDNSQRLNDNLTINNTISIVGDAYANQNYFAMRYARWMGVAWEITNVEVQRPRLILTLGGVYNGAAAE